MPFSTSYLPYSNTNSFSHLVTDYLSNHEHLKPFYQYPANKEGLELAIADRQGFRVNRDLLVKTLLKQYEGMPIHDKVEANIRLLQSENTFTICTAHQPNLLTGYLYFIYKILHAIRLAEELGAEYPQKNFVPIYYMGSEDNDLEELGTFRYNGHKFVWDGGGQTGAVGRMKTESLKPVLDELNKQLGPPGEHCNRLQTMLQEAYLEHETIGEASTYLVNELFGRYGLLVLDADNRELKREFAGVMKDDLLNHTAYDIVTKNIANLAEHYKVQAHPRPINLFYLKDNLRERIEQQGEQWVALHTDIAWTKEELIMELEQYPDRFSPNVILRGLYQETILPNIAFIGGGAEVAYWLQLKPLFEHYGVFYPSVHLRQSVMWVGSKERKLKEDLGLTLEDLFKPEADIIHQYLLSNGNDDWQTAGELTIMEQTMAQLKAKATALDPTLRASAEAAMAKIRHQVQVLEKKMLRAEKQKMQNRLVKITKLKAHLFPNAGLQERVENFITYYLQFGDEFIDTLKEGMEPMRQEFMVAEEGE